MSWETSSLSYGKGQCMETTSSIMQWRKSAGWRKSTRSVNGDACAEIGVSESVILVRDTTNRGGVTLEFPSFVWEMFVDSLK
jgi:hypothetical protein